MQMMTVQQRQMSTGLNMHVRTGKGARGERSEKQGVTSHRSLRELQTPTPALALKRRTRQGTVSVKSCDSETQDGDPRTVPPTLFVNFAERIFSKRLLQNMILFEIRFV